MLVGKVSVTFLSVPSAVYCSSAQRMWKLRLGVILILLWLSWPIFPGVLEIVSSWRRGRIAVSVIVSLVFWEERRVLEFFTPTV